MQIRIVIRLSPVKPGDHIQKITQRFQADTLPRRPPRREDRSQQGTSGAQMPSVRLGVSRVEPGFRTSRKSECADGGGGRPPWTAESLRPLARAALPSRVILCSRRIGTVRVFLSILEQHKTAGRLHRRADRAQHLLWLRKLVVHVHHQHEIDRRHRQPGIVDRTLHERDVRPPSRAQDARPASSTSRAADRWHTPGPSDRRAPPVEP